MHPRHLDYLSKLALRVKTEYDSLTGGTPRDFVERLAQKLLSDKDEEPLRGSINQITTSLQQIQRAENEML